MITKTKSPEETGYEKSRLTFVSLKDYKKNYRRVHCLVNPHPSRTQHDLDAKSGTHHCNDNNNKCP